MSCDSSDGHRSPDSIMTEGVATLHEEPQRRPLQHCRRKQFHFRLAQLQTQIETLEYNIEWANDRNMTLLELLQASEQRLLAAQAEYERARVFPGPEMDSKALHGTHDDVPHTFSCASFFSFFRFCLWAIVLGLNWVVMEIVVHWVVVKAWHEYAFCVEIVL